MLSKLKQLRDSKQRKKVPAKPAPNPSRSRWLVKIGILVAAGACTGIGELIGQHTGDIATVVAGHPLASTSVSGVTLLGVAVSRGGRAAICSVVEWISQLGGR